MSIKGSTLEKMIEDVAQDFADALALKKESLAKSESLRKDFPPAKDEDSKPEEASESKPDASASPAPDAASPAPEASDAPSAAPDAGAPAPDAGAAPAPDAGMGDPAADQALDPAALQAEYAKLSPEELDMHLQAAMAAKQALEGAAGPAAPDAGGPAPAAPAPEMKSEASAGEKSKADELEKSVVAKSEQLNKAMGELEELKKLVKTQSEEIAVLHAGIQKAVNTPDRKAVTTVSHVTREVSAPAKEWTKDGIHSHLKTLTASGKLAKSDRDLINDFYCGVVKIDKLAHLFEGK